jgi:hypothetical protein
MPRMGDAFGAAWRMPGRWFWPGVWAIVLLVSLGQYRHTLSGGFQEYDPIKADWADTQLVLSLAREATLLEYFVKPLPRTGIYYRPGTVAWFWVVWRLLGDRPMVWRLLGLAVHAGVATLLGFLVYICAGSRAPGALAALAFALWGTHGQAVSWMACQPDLVASALSIGAIIVLWWDRWPWRTRVPLSVGLFALAILTKEPAAYAPVFVAATAPLWPVRDSARRRVAALGAFFVVGVLYLGVRYHVLGGLVRGVRAPGLLPIAASLRGYARLLWPPMHALLLFLPSLRLGWLLLLTESLWRLVWQHVLYYGGAVLLLWRARRATLIFALWLLISPLPVFHCMLVGDRYMYLPSMGWPALAGLLIWQVGGALRSAAQAHLARPPKESLR